MRRLMRAPWPGALSTTRPWAGPFAVGPKEPVGGEWRVSRGRTGARTAGGRWGKAAYWGMRRLMRVPWPGALSTTMP